MLDGPYYLGDNGNMIAKRQSSHRIAPTSKTILVVTANQLGISQSAVVELAVRAFAKSEAIRLPPEASAPSKESQVP